jgi:tetratricopeptide (TPR) repeat protein
VNRGLLRAGRREYDAAIEDYDRALKARPDFSLAHLNKAQAYEQSGRLPEAIVAYRAAVQSMGPPYRAEAQRLLAELERRLPQ